MSNTYKADMQFLNDYFGNPALNVVFELFSITQSEWDKLIEDGTDWGDPLDASYCAYARHLSALNISRF